MNDEKERNIFPSNANGPNDQDWLGKMIVAIIFNRLILTAYFL